MNKIVTVGVVIIAMLLAVIAFKLVFTGSATTQPDMAANMPSVSSTAQLGPGSNTVVKMPDGSFMTAEFDDLEGAPDQSYVASVRTVQPTAKPSSGNPWPAGKYFVRIDLGGQIGESVAVGDGKAPYLTLRPELYQ